ncbi:MAG TPA: hypothetical protein VF342_13270 [Alphaproteobacteria bacterium]
MTPSGRELDAAPAYRITVDTDESLTLNLIPQLEPAYLDNAETAILDGSGIGCVLGSCHHRDRKTSRCPSNTRS